MALSSYNYLVIMNFLIYDSGTRNSIGCVNFFIIVLESNKGGDRFCGLGEII